VIYKTKLLSFCLFLFSDGNSLENQPFHLTWAWLSFQSSHIKINETEDLLDVTLLRRGYLGQISIVSKLNRMIGQPLYHMTNLVYLI